MNSSSLNIVEVTNNKLRKEFINLPWTIYKNEPNWVPPLKMAIKDFFSPKHPFYEVGEVKSWNCYQGNSLVGRISAIYNKKYNEYHKTNVGFFGFYESINDDHVSQALLDQAKAWLKTKNCEEVIGPTNLSTNYEAGLLIDGFQDPPQVMMTYNPSYYQEQFEKYGFHKAKDLYAHTLPTDSKIPEVMEKISKRLKEKHNITFRTLKKKNWDREVEAMLEIYNDAWENNWGFVPMTTEEFKHTANDLKLVVEENLALFAMADGKEIGFVVGIPDINQALINIPSGKLLPFGIFKLLGHKKYTNRMRVPTLGVKKAYQKYGVSGLLLQEIRNNAAKTQYKICEASWILEDNINMNKPLFKMGSRIYKTYRIYSKKLQ